MQGSQALTLNSGPQSPQSSRSQAFPSTLEHIIVESSPTSNREASNYDSWRESHHSLKGLSHRHLAKRQTPPSGWTRNSTLHSEVGTCTEVDLVSPTGRRARNYSIASEYQMQSVVQHYAVDIVHVPKPRMPEQEENKEKEQNQKKTKLISSILKLLFMIFCCPLWICMVCCSKTKSEPKEKKAEAGDDDEGGEEKENCYEFCALGCAGCAYMAAACAKCCFGRE